MKPPAFVNLILCPVLCITYRSGLQGWCTGTIGGHKHQLGCTSGWRTKDQGGIHGLYQDSVGPLMGTNVQRLKPNLESGVEATGLIFRQQESWGEQGVSMSSCTRGVSTGRYLATGVKVWTGEGETPKKEGLAWACIWGSIGAVGIRCWFESLWVQDSACGFWTELALLRSICATVETLSDADSSITRPGCNRSARWRISGGSGTCTSCSCGAWWEKLEKDQGPEWVRPGSSLLFRRRSGRENSAGFIFHLCCSCQRRARIWRRSAAIWPDPTAKTRCQLPSVVIYGFRVFHKTFSGGFMSCRAEQQRFSFICLRAHRNVTIKRTLSRLLSLHIEHILCKNLWNQFVPRRVGTII